MSFKFFIQAFPFRVAPNGRIPGILTFALTLASAGYVSNVLAQTPLPNPDLISSCPYNIILVLDESGSIIGSSNGTTSIVSQVRNGARDLIGALNGTGSNVVVVEFNSNARLAVIGGSTIYQPIDDAYVTAFNNYISADNNSNPSASNYDPEDYSCPGNQCYTNWEATFNEIENLNATFGAAELVIFFTDGMPTAYINTSGGVTYGTNNSTTAQALLEATAAANAVKTQGSHIFVVGIPNPNLPESNVRQISGPDKYPNPEPDFIKADYTVSTSATLQQDLAGIPAMISFHITSEVTICDDKFYFAGGAPQNTSGTFIDSFIASSGCDSVVTTILTVLPAARHLLRVPICQGDSVYVGGYYRTEAGIYYDSLTAANGCDSILITAVVIPNCNDLNPCTDDFCNNSLCTSVLKTCDDSIPCTTDLCNGGACFNIPIDCDDSEPCTADSCINGVCLNERVNCEVTLSGFIFSETGVVISNVTVNLTGSITSTTATDSTGYYSFIVPNGGSYAITPLKSNDVAVANGVTTLDMTLITQHILSVRVLNSPYKIIAADASGSSSITTLDAALVSGLVLGNTSSFPHGRLWEFVSSDEVFADPQNPFPFENSRSYNTISQSFSNQNFIGVKLGDVNNSWNPTIP